MKNTLTMLWVMGLISGCASKGDVQLIESEIKNLQEINAEIKTELVNIDAAISASNIQSDSAEQHSFQAEKYFLNSSEKLDLIFNKRGFK